MVIVEIVLIKFKFTRKLKNLNFQVKVKDKLLFYN